MFCHTFAFTYLELLKSWLQKKDHKPEDVKAEMTVCPAVGPKTLC